MPIEGQGKSGKRVKKNRTESGVTFTYEDGKTVSEDEFRATEGDFMEVAPKRAGGRVGTQLGKNGYDTIRTESDLKYKKDEPTKRLGDLEARPTPTPTPDPAKKEKQISALSRKRSYLG